MAEAKRDEVPLPEKVVVDRHLPTGVVIYAYTDDQLREYGRQRVQAALESTAAELEALRKDAERYRWLLDWLNDHNLLRVEYCQIDKPDTLGDWWVLREPYLVGSHVAYGKTEDAAIDAALSTSTAPSGSSAPPPNSGEGGE